VNSIDTLKKYYTLFKDKEKSSKLKVATIFSFNANETDSDPTGLTNSNENSRDFLENCIEDYNTLFHTSFTTKIDGGFYKYYYDISRRFKDNQIDILLVVNMFLTGFDSKKTNTLYVDKNLRYHGLLQAFSRTNRPFNDLKSQGNIVCFRDLKAYTDEAIALFTEGQSDHNNVILKPYEEQLDDFKEIRQDFKQKFSNPTSISNIVSETKKIEFVEIFNKMARKLNTLKAYNDFKWEDLEISEDTFNRYKSKYLDLKTEMEIIIKEPGNHVDYSNIEFETELIQSDTINVDYILNLVKNSVFRSSSKQEKDAQTEKIMLLIKSNPMLKNKEHLISDFILYLTNSGHKYNESSNILDVFEIFLNIERAKKIHQLANREHLIEDRLINIIDQYLYDQRKPEYNEIGPIFSTRPSILQLNQKVKEIQTQIVDFVDTYYL
jgi:type I restriction enzyme R subunit